MTSYLKCDSAGCDHREDTPDYGPHLIGKPCPLCGANLLTQDDFDGYEPMRLMMQALIEAGLASEHGEGLKDPVDLEVGHHAGKSTISFGAPKRADGAA